VEVQVRLEGSGSEPAEEYTFFIGKGNENHELGAVPHHHKRTISAVKRVESVSYQMPYKILRGRWCRITVLNVHAPTEDKTEDVKGSFYVEVGTIFNKFPIYSMRTLLIDFNVKVGREDIFKPTFGNESLHKIHNNNGVRTVNFATSKNLKVKSTTIPHYNIHKYTWMSPRWETP
jgi:hypothetical protein